MAKHIYGDRDAPVFAAAPEGDYKLECTDYEFGVSNGGKTGGCETLKLTLEVVPAGNKVWETVIFGYEKTAWRVDSLLKAFNCAPGKDEDIDINQDFVEKHILGKEAFAHLIVEEYIDKTNQKRSTNRVGHWIDWDDAIKDDPESNQVAAAAAKSDEEISEDDIPF